jgi:hypothetical protein
MKWKFSENVSCGNITSTKVQHYCYGHLARNMQKVHKFVKKCKILDSEIKVSGYSGIEVEHRHSYLNTIDGQR